MIMNKVASCLFAFNSFISLLLEKVYLLPFSKLNVHELPGFGWGYINVQNLCKLVFLLSSQEVSMILFFDISLNLSFREGSRIF